MVYKKRMASKSYRVSSEMFGGFAKAFLLIGLVLPFIALVTGHASILGGPFVAVVAMILSLVFVVWPAKLVVG
jgi:hypothetical protein